MTSFFSYSADQRIKKNNLLLKLNKLIEWSKIKNRLNKLYKKDIQDKGGERPYDPLKMFKAILLGQWYSLSDPGLEEALNVRLDFMMFTGFELLEDCPDATTLCRFRNRIIEKGLDKKFFNEINQQLERLGLKLKEAHGAIIDATIIESSARSKRQLTIEEDRKENEEINCKIIESKDTDSRWLKKGSKSFYGYKGFVSVDSEKGYINNIHVTSANIAEVNQFENLIDDNCQRVYADKAYASDKNRNFLKEKKIKDGIMLKASKNQKLSRWQRVKNKLISKKRYMVEQCFGTIKRRFNFNRASYIGLEKVEGQLYFKAICYNLLKGIRMVEIRC